MKTKNSSPKSKAQKRSLISAIIGISIAVFTFICCGLLVPLSLIGAAVILHQYRTPLIILGIAIAGVSILFMLRGKNIICVCEAFDLIKKYKKLIIISIGVIICISLAIFAVSNFLLPSARNFISTNPINSKSTRLEWKSSKVDPELVRIVNFLEENIGKEIELSGKGHLITSQETISIKIIMLECCTKGEFAEMLDNISKIGKVKGSDFSKKEILAELPANEIPKIAEIWNVKRIDLEQKSKDMYNELK